MNKQNKKELSVQEGEDLLEKVLWGLRSVINILVFFFIIVILLRYALKIPFSLWFNFWIAFWILCLFIFIFFIKRQRDASIINKAHFGFFVLQILILTIIVHYLGGIESIGVLFCTFFIVYGIFLLPKKYNLLIVLISLSCFFTLACLEYLEILPHYTLFAGGDIFKNPIGTLSRLTIIIASFFLLFIITSRLSERMRIQTEDLTKSQSKLKTLNLELENKVGEFKEVKNALEDAKATLEIKVKARTRELEELAQGLEKEVKQRTKELQNKLQELERFQKFAVGREMKMVELKKEIKRLKEEKGG